MVIVNVTNQLKKELRESNFSPLFLENCLNSKFLSIEKNEKKIVGACFVGGTFNSNGIEIIKEFQGMGLGKKLLDEIISECQKRKIRVHLRNPRLNNLNKKSAYIREISG